MKDVGPLLHNSDKLLCANTINGPRLHLFRHVDMINTEQSASSYPICSVNAWLGLAKPIVMWTTGIQPVESSSNENYVDDDNNNNNDDDDDDNDNNNNNNNNTSGTNTDQSDLFFQRLLHLGLFPMPPMPSADHSLQPGDNATHQKFMEYGPLFKALQGRAWVLRPYAVAVSAAPTRGKFFDFTVS